MLTIQSSVRSHRFCDHRSRRDFLRIGGLGLAGLTLPQLLRAESERGARSHKAVIMVYLPGGPPHQDMYDLKPDAPAEIRGEFDPINTNVPGIQICELLPRLAGMMDKFVPIRSIVGSIGDHASFQCLSGRSDRKQPPGGWPEFGSAVAKVQGATSESVPPFVGLSPRMQHKPYNSGKPGFLGPALAPFQPNGDGKEDLVLQGVTLERLADRQQLHRALDQLNANLDGSGMMGSLDAFHQQAVGMLKSNRLAHALDISKESPETLARYGKSTAKHQGDGAPRLTEQFLIARRLVEAGVRCVTLSFSFWDFHGQNFRGSRENMPVFDQAITALVEDLYARGLDKDVTVCAWGEFGRTPKINNNAGRDHWPNVSCALLAGGGLRTGQVIGSTDRIASEAKDRPVHFQEVLATLYNRLGIDGNQVTLNDLAGRPQYLVDHYQPLRELI
ncbi:MAG: DUF1501 domain-containing protein [Planctomycetes bacterium]|nr:DUF1501 domain-containing protein [Planctomycetota bacterium]